MSAYEDIAELDELDILEHPNGTDYQLADRYAREALDNVYTKAQINAMLSGKLDRQIVQTLPTTDISTSTIYMVPKPSAKTTNAYNEYMYISGNWELMGDTETDMSNYYTKAQIDTLLAAIIDDNIVSTSKTWSSSKLDNSFITQDQINELLQSQVTKTQEVIGLGGNNLIPYPYKETTKTVNGITFTDNGDRSITISGTATADIHFLLAGSDTYSQTSDFTVPLKHTYKLTLTDTPVSNVYMEFNAHEDEEHTETILCGSVIEAYEFNYKTYLTDDPIQSYVALFIRKDTVVTNLRVTPVILDLNDASNINFQPTLTPGNGININSNNVISAKVDGVTTEFDANGNIKANIPSLANYYTQTQVNNLLDNKQDTLIAGTGISISNNVISATGGSGGGSLTEIARAQADGVKTYKDLLHELFPYIQTLSAARLANAMLVLDMTTGTTPIGWVLKLHDYDASTFTFVEISTMVVSNVQTTIRSFQCRGNDYSAAHEVKITGNTSGSTSAQISYTDISALVRDFDIILYA